MVSNTSVAVTVTGYSITVGAAGAVASSSVGGNGGDNIIAGLM